MRLSRALRLRIRAARTAAMAVAAGDPEKEVIPAVAAVIPAVSRAAT